MGRHVRRTVAARPDVPVRRARKDSRGTSLVESRQALGATACPIANPTVPANEALINGNEDCQRTALLSFMNTRLGMNEAVPIEHPIETLAVLAKIDVAASTKTNVSGSWNFNHSRKENETFDVATYGPSANGVEGDLTHQRREPELVHHAVGTAVERGAFHARKGEPPADGRRVEHSRRIPGWGLARRSASAIRSFCSRTSTS